jgi:hypothetical protein
VGAGAAVAVAVAVAATTPTPSPELFFVFKIIFSNFIIHSFINFDGTRLTPQRLWCGMYPYP